MPALALAQWEPQWDQGPRGADRGEQPGAAELAGGHGAGPQGQLRRRRAEGRRKVGRSIFVDLCIVICLLPGTEAASVARPERWWRRAAGRRRIWRRGAGWGLGRPARRTGGRGRGRGRLVGQLGRRRARETAPSIHQEAGTVWSRLQWPQWSNRQYSTLVS
jgi:hypothetical protein